MTAAFDTLVQGLMLGGLYGLYAAGLSMMFGVMRLVNVAHGDLITLAAFVGLVLQRVFGIESMMLLAALVVPILALTGYLLQRGVLNAALGGEMLRPVLTTFGLSVVIQNGLQQVFSADAQRLQAGGFELQSLSLGYGLYVGVFPLTVFALSVAVIAALQALLYRTRLGRAFRATSDDGVVAAQMGVHDRHLFGLATAVSMAVVGLAGVLMGIRATYGPASGPEQLIFAFEAVIVGGLGSLWGTLCGGVLLGLAQSIGARAGSELQFLAGHVLFLLVLMLRPRGLFPKVHA